MGVAGSDRWATGSVESGTIRPVVETVYPLASTAAAHRRLEDGGVHGKVVIAVTP
ncbi:zinc-binding dehydrogenase [Asanoa sp. WMMD1127]|uniref:zinc-binding dehydrogenase n=1 Tax=Asanoa sp. WMMD1127 TaxID=3016107 RepID=UPI00241657A2|nr:zinc-binding dehydrogenase [Asanoa sp. WMMD1127]MDG4824994.1 zinc-binding dehydrogenase [Asanoa sp. WMMD1127]